jgi:hypothetical protein
MISTLLSTLLQVGKPAVVWTSPDGSRVVILPYGGRILGLYPWASDKNFFWTHTALRQPETARTFYESTEWHNSGGDRTWLSPEIDFFLPHYPSLDVYHQPREFDPGTYQLTLCDGMPVLENNFVSRLSRSKHTVHLKLTKRVTPACNPLRRLDRGLASQLMYAGFTLDTRLQIMQSSGPVELNLWSLLQLPHGGELIIPTYSRSSVVPFMGQIGDDDLTIDDRSVRYRMRARGEHKIGLPAHSVTGRLAYCWRDEELGTRLVIRNIAVNPSARYLDSPWNRPDSPGAAVEACNVNSSLGAFSELEHHAPAIRSGSGQAMSADVSQTWAFCGPEDGVRRATELLLGVAL